MLESWEKGYEILNRANKKAEKYRLEVQEIMHEKKFSNEKYEKIKELLEKEALIKSNAYDQMEKIRRKEIWAFEQEENL